MKIDIPELPMVGGSLYFGAFMLLVQLMNIVEDKTWLKQIIE